MKKVDDMLDEYDFSGKKGMRGKYAKAFRNGYSVRTFDGGKLASEKFYAAIDNDVREYFGDSKSINKALRALILAIPNKRGSSPR